MEDAERAAYLLSRTDAFAHLEYLGNEVERAAARDPAGAADCGHALMATAVRLSTATTHSTIQDATRFAVVLARLRRATTLALAYSGRLDESIALGELNRSEALVAEERIEAARALLSLMHPLLKAGRTEQAISAGEMAHTELVQLSRADLAARADINLGNIRKSLGDSVATLRHLDRAAALLGSDSSMAAHIENTRGEALLALDRFSDARRAFSMALQWAQNSSAGFAVGLIEGNLADLAARSGELHEALQLFGRARAGITARGHSARLLLEEADVLLALGLAPLAVQRLKESVAIVDEAGLAFEGMRASLALSRALAAMGRAEEATQLAGRAAERAVALGDAPGEARAFAMQALLLTERGLCAEAARALQRAYECDGDPSPSDGVGRLLIGSRLALRRSLPLDSLRLANDAAQLANEIGAAPLEADAFVQLARVQRLTGNSVGAVSSAQAAVAATERVRSALGAELLRRSYLGRSVDAYEELVLAHLGNTRPDSAIQAWEAAERGKGRSLLERALAARTSTDAAVSVSSGWSDARAQLDTAYRLMVQSNRSSLVTSSDSHRPSDHADRVREIHARLSQLEGELTRWDLEAAAALPQTRWVASETSAQKIQQALGPDEALVEYFRAGGDWIVFVATRDTVRAIKCGVSDASIQDAISRVGFHIRKALRDARAGRTASVDQVVSTLEALGAALWQPASEFLDLPRRLIIVPHGPLHAVPFAALRHRDHWVIDDHEVCVLPSAAMLPMLVECRPPRTESSLVVGVADMQAPEIKNEALAVANALAVTPLLDAQATAEEVARQLCTCHRAHLACHGQFFPEAPWSSGLRLFDRWLGTRDVYDLPSGPREVVLSGCDTAGLDVLAGDELTGLVHAFLARGAQSVVASLWSANDASTLRIMMDLYKTPPTLVGVPSLSPSRLRKAQLLERARSPHPAFWAPFTFTGVHS
jgi:CHAT domain-containing protein/tetratricopeptide (TPR) repeat protein